MEKKEDQRIRLSKKLIEDSFIDLLVEKPLLKINVKEVCEKANVNRSTFYAHYQDILDLYEKIKEKITESIKNYLDNSFDVDKNMDFYKEIFKFFEDNQQVVKVFLGLQVDNDFINSLLSMSEDKVFSVYKKKYFLINEKKFREYFTFASHGTIGIINKWITNGMREPYQEIAKTCESISIKGIKYLYKL